MLIKHAVTSGASRIREDGRRASQRRIYLSYICTVVSQQRTRQHERRLRETTPSPPTFLQCIHTRSIHEHRHTTNRPLPSPHTGPSRGLLLDTPQTRPRQPKAEGSKSLSPLPKRRSPGARRHLGPAPSQHQVLAETKRKSPSLPQARINYSGSQLK